MALAGATITYESANENQTFGKLSCDAIANNPTEPLAGYQSALLAMIETGFAGLDRRTVGITPNAVVFHSPYPREAW